MSFSGVYRSLLLGTALSIAAFAPAAQAKHYQVLHSFGGSDGSGPNGNLALDSAGNLYGATVTGGAFNDGTIFKLSPAGTFTTLYSFTGGDDGRTPEGSVTLDPVTGDLYGTVSSNGTQGWGGVFKLTPAGVLDILHYFNQATDGTSPSAALTRDPAGNFYGTTLEDGAHGNGTVFELAANGRFQILHTLGAADGGLSSGRLALHGTDLYGITTEGPGGGSVFQVDFGGTFTTLHAMNMNGFPGGGLARDGKGNLYGAFLDSVNGYVYKLSADGTFAPFYTFTGGADGRFPAGDLVLSRAKHEIYGTAARGGANGDNGTVFKLDLKGNFTLLHGFSGPPRDGTAPTGGLVRSNGKLYGTTDRGGANDMGIIFAVSTK
jgi:uncharacterized repeat protein (TIGR03803 family)